MRLLDANILMYASFDAFLICKLKTLQFEWHATQMLLA